MKKWKRDDNRCPVCGGTVAFMEDRIRCSNCAIDWKYDRRGQP